jgi:hypothetical protein
VFRLFLDQDWATLRAVGLTSTLHLPGHSTVVVKALVTLVCMGEANLPSRIYLDEFMALCCLLNISFEQVTTWFPPRLFVCTIVWSF